MSRPSKNLKLALTGATGFVGANLCRHFLEQGHEVIALTGPTRTDWRLPSRAPGLTKTYVDLASDSAIREFISTTQPQVLINCAAYGAYSSQNDPSKIYRVCFEAVRTMLDALTQIQGFRAFIQMGSQSEYGLNCTAPDESSAPLPDSHYAVAKVAASAAIQFYGKKLGLPAWCFRLYSVYGAYEDPSRLIIKLLDRVQHNQLPPLTNPKISRDFIHVTDVCRAVDAIIAQADRLPKGEIYNIATGTCTTLESLVKTTQQTFGLTAQPDWGSMPDRDWDHADWYGNPAKAKHELGWQATMTLREGLEKTMNWIKDHPEAMLLANQQSVAPKA